MSKASLFFPFFPPAYSFTCCACIRTSQRLIHFSQLYCRQESTSLTSSSLLASTERWAPLHGCWNVVTVKGMPSILPTRLVVECHGIDVDVEDSSAQSNFYVSFPSVKFRLIKMTLPNCCEAVGVPRMYNCIWEFASFFS